MSSRRRNIRNRAIESSIKPPTGIVKPRSRFAGRGTTFFTRDHPVPKGRLHIGGGYHVAKPKVVKGGRVKVSTAFTGVGTATAIGSAVQPEFAPVLAPVSAISFGLGQVFSAFGKGLPKPKKKRGRKKKGRKKKR